ncbi:MAG: DUF4170 domain-containing protein [Pikeienuella sp.]
MTVRLHLVFGGELRNAARNEFADPDNLDVIGVFPSYAKAYDAWKEASQRTVDSATTRYFIAHLHRLRDEERIDSQTEEIG